MKLREKESPNNILRFRREEREVVRGKRGEGGSSRVESSFVLIGWTE